MIPVHPCLHPPSHSPVNLLHLLVLLQFSLQFCRQFFPKYPALHSVNTQHIKSNGKTTLSFQLFSLCYKCYVDMLGLKKMKYTYAEFSCLFKMLKSNKTDKVFLTTFIANLVQREKKPVLQ